MLHEIQTDICEEGSISIGKATLPYRRTDFENVLDEEKYNEGQGQKCNEGQKIN
jgi:hypothetical protein